MTKFLIMKYQWRDILWHNISLNRYFIIRKMDHQIVTYNLIKFPSTHKEGYATIIRVHQYEMYVMMLNEHGVTSPCWPCHYSPVLQYLCSYKLSTGVCCGVSSHKVHLFIATCTHNEFIWYFWSSHITRSHYRSQTKHTVCNIYSLQKASVYK